jgi:hypothetical protein
MPGNSPSARAADAATSIEDTEFIDTKGADIRGTEDTGAFTTGGFAASTDSVEISSGAMGIGPRWDTFQNRLRERRKEVITSGSTPESADRYKKAS